VKLFTRPTTPCLDAVQAAPADYGIDRIVVRVTRSITPTAEQVFRVLRTPGSDVLDLYAVTAQF
jgi:hypothetical protein